MTSKTLAQPLARLPRNDEGLMRYRHPNGWSIRQARRDWDARGYRGGMAADPKMWWEVRPWATTARSPEVFYRLRDAREYCDLTLAHTLSRCPTCNSRDPGECWRVNNPRGWEPHPHGGEPTPCCPDPWHTGNADREAGDG